MKRMGLIQNSSQLGTTGLRKSALSIIEAGLFAIQPDNVMSSAFHFHDPHLVIKNNEFEPTISIAEILLDDKHDLIHKAVGWMLREIGKRDKKALENFLKEHYKKMPRTTLRYAIERFPENEKKIYLKSKT